MASKQYKEHIINFNNLESIPDENLKLFELIFNYKASYLQARLDLEDLELDKLKIITIDKLLRLNFPNNFVAFYDDNNYLLTKDEMTLLNNQQTDTSTLTFIKKQFSEEKVIYKITFKEKPYFLILNEEKNNLLILNFIKWVLENNDK